MILLVDLCYRDASLSRFEFVDPLADAIRRCGHTPEIRHYSRPLARAGPNCQGAILCGTALKDSSYLDHLEALDWVSRFDRPVLGICAGMQVFAALFGGEIVPSPAIGLAEIEIVEESPLLGERRTISGYHLHNFGTTLPPGFLKLAGKQLPEAFRHPEKPIYGILFHPEVRNRWIVERFCTLAAEI